MILKEWIEKAIISYTLWKKLYPTTEDKPKFYGLAKAHETAS